MERDYEKSYDYKTIVRLFLTELLKERDTNANININETSGYNNKFIDIVFEIITNVFYKENDGGHNTTHNFSFLEGVNVEVIMDIYTFLNKYKSIFHLDTDMLFMLKEKVMGMVSGLNKKESEKKNDVKEDETDIDWYILVPKLNDLLEDKIFKLVVDGKQFMVPLWYDEMLFEYDIDIEHMDTKKTWKKEIRVKCVPDLDENMSIDENNNLLVNISIPLSSQIFNHKEIPVVIDNTSGKIYTIPLSELSLKRVQTYVLKNEGIRKIDENDEEGLLDIHENSDNSHRADIIFRITFI